jgi:hypothetical protein
MNIDMSIAAKSRMKISSERERVRTSGVIAWMSCSIVSEEGI